MAGVTNTGGGGGGGAYKSGNGPGAAGGSGIVIVRYVTSSGAPVLSNADPTSVTTNSATFNGMLNYTGSSACAVCVLWGDNDGGATWNWDNTNWFNGGNPNPAWTNNTPFSTNIALNTDKTYYYTFATTNATTNAVASGPKSFITGGVTVQATDASAKYPGDNGEYTIYRPATCTGEAMTVYFAMSGTGVENTNYTLSLSGSLMMNAGESNKVVTLTPLSLSAKTAILTLTAASTHRYPIGTSSNATVTIQASDAKAAGGTVTNYTLGGTNYTAHIFTNVGTTSIEFGSGGTVEYLVVGGGGCAGANGGGGGGAGGVRVGTYTVSAASYPIVLGAGGTPTNVSGVTRGGSGGNSSVFGTTAVGGGGGASRDGGGAGYSSAGGSGGGGGGGGSPQNGKGSATGGYGNDGGNGTTDLGGSSAGGGGGGYASAGTGGASKQGGNGGDGYWSSISGVYTGYAGGGAGSGMDYNSFGGKAGTVQAGAGGGGPQNSSRVGRPNSGGGGGSLATGLNSGDSGGGDGGSGIVIVRYVVGGVSASWSFYRPNIAIKSTSNAIKTQEALR
jgi:hypothetical protein